MRPLRLDLAGFTVFRDPTVIDFTDADFFALVGPTGSGKSSVLDAICFALYGTVPRWGDRRAIANALAPSSTEARVRLAFESAGARYVATRVVRRDGKGRVTTGQAGLQLMPPGFDVSKLDSGLSTEDLGEVLAGTPAEMEPAVLDAVGLPYEQFVTCVVLPQGDFAEFLHAKPATRQQILVNLLGLSVYERVRERAGALGAAADAQLAAVDRLLADASDVDDETLTDAQARVDELTALAVAVDAAVPGLLAAERDATAAGTQLSTLDGELARLAGVRTPAGIAALAESVTLARTGLVEALAAVTGAEEREEKLRGELAAAGDATALRRLLDGYAERDRLGGQAAALDEAVAAAVTEHEAALAVLAEARSEATRATQTLDGARQAYQDAQTADRAAALRVHLAVGRPCPVCAQPVATLPAATHTSALAEAEEAGKAARSAAESVARIVAERDEVARDLDRVLAGARAQRDQLGARLAELDTQLATTPAAAILHRELAAIAALNAGLDDAAAAVRSAREAHRRAATAQKRAEDKLRAGWLDFDAARDSVAQLGPPGTDRDDLAAAWAALAGWAGSEVDSRREARSQTVAAVEAAEAAIATATAEIAALFTAAGLTVAATSGKSRPPAASEAATSRKLSEKAAADYSRAAAVAVERAHAEYDRLVERRAQTERLRAQRAEHERDAQVAKALAGHLRANNFERWLLAEALDLLVDGASRTLRELSAGQYDLVHDKGEFYVIDHHDAGLRRAVRTL
ncbi:MAG TPA: SMC family ATPase, partial [Micromonosporaceae bacterium]|nr:SMC family ATPase [Micromonosporaceae bacterium]